LRSNGDAFPTNREPRYPEAVVRRNGDGIAAMRRFRMIAGAALLPLLAAACAVDRTTGERAATGAAVGAASGAAIGLLRGDFLGSALTGAAAGAAGGFVYDQIQKD
jgi:hypothetical protein